MSKMYNWNLRIEEIIKKNKTKQKTDQGLSEINEKYKAADSRISLNPTGINIPRHLIITLLNSKEKEKNLRSSQVRRTHDFWEQQ